MSSAEAEYVAAVGCYANILWIKSQLTNYAIIYENIPIFCDNTRDIELHFIPTQYQLVDIFIKPLDEPTFRRLIVALDVYVESQALKNSSKTKKNVPQGKKSGASSGLKRKQSSKNTFDSKTEASKSKTGQSDKEIQSSLTKDKRPSHPLSFKPLFAEMHKKAQQADNGLTSLGATSKEGAHPQLSSETNPSVLIDTTKSAGGRLKTMHTSLGTNGESRSDEISKKIKLEDLSNIMQDTRSNFISTDFSKPIIVVGQANPSLAEGEKNITQATKDVDNANLKQQPTTTTPPTDSMVKSSKKKKLKKFSFVFEGGEQIHFNAEKIKEQKRIEETLKAELAK
nr:hypothetical protein [Tanacetum cinerariifolium]